MLKAIEKVYTQQKENQNRQQKGTFSRALDKSFRVKLNLHA
jgi:hypothetical protein